MRKSGTTKNRLSTRMATAVPIA
ncbi:MAG: hypothetical protein RLZZ58_512, partial [Pseudomonadota bacterium]